MYIPLTYSPQRNAPSSPHNSCANRSTDSSSPTAAEESLRVVGGGCHVPGRVGEGEKVERGEKLEGGERVREEGEMASGGVEEGVRRR